MQRLLFLLLCACPAAADELDVVLALDPDLEWGGYLAGTCVTCHAEGAQGVPALSGAPKEHVAGELLRYRSGAREHAAMQMIAGGLTDADIAALAAHFSVSE